MHFTRVRVYQGIVPEDLSAINLSIPFFHHTGGDGGSKLTIVRCKSKHPYHLSLSFAGRNSHVSSVEPTFDRLASSWGALKPCGSVQGQSGNVGGVDFEVCPRQKLACFGGGVARVASDCAPTDPLPLLGKGSRLCRYAFEEAEAEGGTAGSAKSSINLGLSAGTLGIFLPTLFEGVLPRRRKPHGHMTRFSTIHSPCNAESNLAPKPCPRSSGAVAKRQEMDVDKRRCIFPCCVVDALPLESKKSESSLGAVTTLSCALTTPRIVSSALAPPLGLAVGSAPITRAGGMERTRLTGAAEVSVGQGDRAAWTCGRDDHVLQRCPRIPRCRGIMIRPSELLG